MPLKWELIYSVNIKEIDNQHRKIFFIINDILEIAKDYNEDKLIAAIKELKDYGNYHFDTEEKYFKKFNYPHKKHHILEHHEYKEKIIEFERKIENNEGATVIKELINYLGDWWLNHIQILDQQYSKFFNKNGLF